MAHLATARCDDCDASYPTTAVLDRGLCPRCQRIEDAAYALAVPIVDHESWRFSRGAMRERLGVGGDRDE